jgi:hypothetical protein
MAEQNTQQKPPPETFSTEYVKNLEEGWRLKLSEAEAKIIAAQTATNDRIVLAEMKAAALKAGMIDEDGLKMADLSRIKLNKDGGLEGAAELLANLKQAKPYLFAQPPGSSHAGSPPPPKAPHAKKATEMSAAEYAIARRAATGKR